MHTNLRKTAEDFIEKIVAPRRERQRSEPKGSRARSDLARDDLEHAKRELAKAGLEPERLDRLAAERSKAHKKLVEQGRRNAVEASAAAAQRLRDLTAVIVPLEPVDTVVDQVTFIRSFAGQGSVIESNIAPSDNLARYRLESDDDVWDGTGRLSFFALWQNKLDTPTVLMARPNLIINAHLSCDAEWNGVASWFGFSSEARASVRARTTVWSMDSSISSIVHDEEVGNAVARGGFFGDDSSDSIEFNQILAASGVSVPAQEYVLIEVELLTEWHANSASVVLDAEGGSHRVDVPQILLSEIRPQQPGATITLQANAVVVGSGTRVTLTWTGATGANVDIYRDGALLITTANDGQYVDTPVPSGSHVYRLCNAGSTTCSANVTVMA